MNRTRLGMLISLLLALSLTGCGNTADDYVFTNPQADPAPPQPTAAIQLDPIPGDQEDAEISADSFGNFIVVWEQLSPLDPDLADIRAQRFTPSGAPLGEPFTVTSDARHDFRPAVAGGPNGTFVVTWSRRDPDLDSSFVLARRYDGEDQPLGTEFEVSQQSVQYEESVDIAMDAQGDFVITWAGSSLGDEQESILARTFSAEGTPTTDAFLVDTFESAIGDPSVASDATGNFTVVWTRLSTNPDVVIRRYNAGGTPLGEGNVVGPADDAGRFSAEIDMAADGEAVVVYTYSNDGGTSLSVAMVRLDNTGSVQGSEVFLSSDLERSFDPAVALLPDGSFTACWEEVLEGDHDILQIGRFAPDGAALSPLSRLGTGTADDEFDGFFDVNADGVLGVSWDEVTSGGPNGTVSDAFVRFFPLGTP